MRILDAASRFRTSSRITAASFPPSSMQTGIKLRAADTATSWPTRRDPMNVRWLIPGCDVRCEATSGQHVIDWISSEGCPQIRNADRAMSMKNWDDHAVASDPLTTIPFPAKMAEMMGPMTL